MWTKLLENQGNNGIPCWVVFCYTFVQLFFHVSSLQHDVLTFTCQKLNALLNILTLFCLCLHGVRKLYKHGERAGAETEVPFYPGIPGTICHSTFVEIKVGSWSKSNVVKLMWKATIHFFKHIFVAASIFFNKIQ